ncbi:MAG TPA: hypothetical protein VK522_22600 [Pseudolabrys sp.]|nr:hypothetical protein [Pseudolabrys sp.]
MAFMVLGYPCSMSWLKGFLIVAVLGYAARSRRWKYFTWLLYFPNPARALPAAAYVRKR